MVAEGVKSSRAIVAIAHDADVEMPISEAVVSVLYEGVELSGVIGTLMARSAKPEIYGL
jgi:glycerol-3-phosphate dehydrogenase (NAD(P)+)